MDAVHTLYHMTIEAIGKRKTLQDTHADAYASIAATHVQGTPEGTVAAIEGTSLRQHTNKSNGVGAAEGGDRAGEGRSEQRITVEILRGQVNKECMQLSVSLSVF